MTVSKDHYYRLASELEDERISAATELVKELQAADNTPDWDYALDRLIKGLSSNRAASRVGFSMALIEILTLRIESQKYTIKQFLDSVVEKTMVKQSMKGKEERSVLFGRLFGLQVLLNSKLLNEQLKASEFTSFFSVIDLLFELATIKSWLREPTVFTITNLMAMFLSLNLSSASEDKLLLHVLQKAVDAQLMMSSEGIAVCLSIPIEKRSKLLQQLDVGWKNGNPLSKGNLQNLAKVLKDISFEDQNVDEDEGNKKGAKKSKQKGSWNPRLHFVWTLIVGELTGQNANDEKVTELASRKRQKSSSSKSNKKSKSNSKAESIESDQLSIKEFWKAIVDESLFSQTSSPERKYWGFELFKLLFENIEDSQVSNIVTRNFSRCLINQTSNSDRLLNKAARNVLSHIEAVCSKQPQKAITIIKNLISGYGTIYFDRVTKTRTIDDLVSNISIDYIAELRDYFFSILENPTLVNGVLDKEKEKETEDKGIENVQRWTLDKLLLLVRSKKSAMITGDVEWIDKILEVLVTKSFFRSVDSKKAVYNSDSIATIAQERINSILSDIITVSRSDNITWSYLTLKFLLNFEKDAEKYEPRYEIDESLRSTQEKSLKTLRKIRQKRQSSKHTDSKQLTSFELLFSMVLLQFYTGDEESHSVLEELQMCYSNIASKSPVTEYLDEEESEVDSAQILTEIILSFASRKSTLLKKLSMIIWEWFCTDIGEDSLTLLYDILVSKENKEGQTKLFEGEDEYEDDIESDSNDEDESEDEEEEEEEEEEEDENENDDDFDVDNDSDTIIKESSSKEILDVEKKTNIALAEALGIPQHDGEVKFDDISSGSEDSNYESDSMDDEQMMAIDNQLSRIFKERHDALSSVPSGNKRKAEVQEARENMIFFKNRVLNLLEIYIRVCPSSPLIVTSIKPIITLMQLTLDQDLRNKAHKLLKNKICKCKVDLDTTNNEETDRLLKLIGDIQIDASKSSNQAHSQSCNQACIFVTKILVSKDTSFIDKIIDLYTQSMKDWFKSKGNKINASMFFDFVNWLNSKKGDN